MKPLKIGVSGVRGVVGETLTPELRRRIRAGVRDLPRRRPGARVPGTRDQRPDGLLGGDCRSPCIRCRSNRSRLSAPTPSLALAVPCSGRGVGVSIHGGHNPAHWNALKFLRSDASTSRRPRPTSSSTSITKASSGRCRGNRISTTIRARGRGRSPRCAPFGALRHRGRPGVPAHGRGGLLQRVVLGAHRPLAPQPGLRRGWSSTDGHPGPVPARPEPRWDTHGAGSGAREGPAGAAVAACSARRGRREDSA